MLKALVLSFLAAMAITTIRAKAQTTTTAVCRAQGTNVGGNDMGAFTSDSRLSLRVTKDKATGLLSLSAEGIVMVAQNFEGIEDFALLSPENSYIGMFDVQLQENPDYRPIVYHGYSQFKDFDAAYTIGNESGMWGYLVIEKDYDKDDKFTAVYIFQAGDHLGGSLFFGCRHIL